MRAKWPTNIIVLWLLAAAVFLYPFTASYEYGLGYYLYAIPLALAGMVAIYDDKHLLQRPAIRWLLAYVGVAAVVSLVHAVLGYTYALKHPPMYVVITLACVGAVHGLTTSRGYMLWLLRYAVAVAIGLFVVYFAVGDYALGELYAYPSRINQFAMWCFMIMVLLDVLALPDDKGRGHWLLMLALSFLAITTLSRAATLGVLLYWMTGLVLGQSPRIILAIGGALTGIVTMFFVLDNMVNSSYYSETFAARYQDFRMFDPEFFLKDRGYNKIIQNPQYLLYGAAEGQPERFGDKVTVHNSLIGPWFSYGIVGLIGVLGFVRSTWRSTGVGWRVALALAPTLFFHDVTHMFLPYFILIAIALIPRDDKFVSS